jgi:methylenetetrahydrofolate dehydrogenase (NADP+) / methenyltetrahydrofolate cyclohydrolase
MIVDGRKIANEIKEELKQKIQNSDNFLTLTIFVSDNNLATKQFVNIKKKFASDIGVNIVEENINSEANTDELIRKIKNMETDGIVIQLPILNHIDVRKILNTIPKNMDIDVLSESAIEKFKNGTLPILPPVVGAIKEIVDRYNISVSGKKAVIIGKGKLVGEPSAIWFRNHGAYVFVADSKTDDISKHTKEADIIVSGVGIPNLITPDMINEGAVLFDAGASEEGGKLVGDADPACASKCSIFTPVPGGIGPITIAVLFRNLLDIIHSR